MKLSDNDIKHYNDDWSSPDSDNGKKSEPDDINNLAPLNNITDCIKHLCDTCIESKYTKIVKHKAITPTVQKLGEIYTDLWGPHN